MSTQKEPCRILLWSIWAKNKTKATSQAGSFQVRVLMNFLLIFFLPLSAPSCIPLSPYLALMPFVVIAFEVICINTSERPWLLVFGIPFSPHKLKHTWKTQQSRGRSCGSRHKVLKIPPKYFDRLTDEGTRMNRLDIIKNNKLFYKKNNKLILLPIPHWTHLIFPFSFIRYR